MIHVVAEGESIDSIAASYGISPYDLAHTHNHNQYYLSIHHLTYCDSHKEIHIFPTPYVQTA